MKKISLDMAAITVATGFGAGLFPVAPGTAGSLLGPPLIWAVLQLSLPLPAVLAIGAVFILAGIPICTRASKAMVRHDPGEIVFDEIAAFWIVFLPQIVMSQSLDPLTMCVGFVLFRIFDIAKPWPIQRLEKLPHGTGIMVDDLAAAAYAAVCLVLFSQTVELLATD